MTTVLRLPALAALACALLLVIGSVPPAVHAQTPTEIDRYFKVEWDPEAVPRGGWAVQGYVVSSHDYRVNGVRLLVEVLDSAGEVENRAFGWVPGDVPAGGRAYFFVSVPKRGAAYRVKVLSYFLVSRETAVTREDEGVEPTMDCCARHPKAYPGAEIVTNQITREAMASVLRNADQPRCPVTSRSGAGSSASSRRRRERSADAPPRPRVRRTRGTVDMAGLPWHSSHAMDQSLVLLLM